MALRSNSRGSARSNKDATSQPLLDDVNQLIEKEKILKELQVLEQQQQAYLWKHKYDKLLGTVPDDLITNRNHNGNLISENVAGSSNLDESPADSNSNSSISNYLHKRGDHYILDMSHKNSSFVITKISNGLKILEQYDTLLKSIYLRDCELTDDHAPLLCTLISNSATTGIQTSTVYFDNIYDICI